MCVCVSHTKPLGKHCAGGLRGSREIPVSSSSSWLSGEMGAWVCNSRRSCRECKLSSGLKSNECSWAEVMSKTWMTWIKKCTICEVCFVHLPLVYCKHVWYRGISKSRSKQCGSPSCWEYSAEWCSNMDCFFQDPALHHALKGPKSATSEEGSQLVPAAACGHTQNTGTEIRH